MSQPKPPNPPKDKNQHGETSAAEDSPPAEG